MKRLQIFFATIGLLSIVTVVGGKGYIFANQRINQRCEKIYKANEYTEHKHQLQILYVENKNNKRYGLVEIYGSHPNISVDCDKLNKIGLSCKNIKELYSCTIRFYDGFLCTQRHTISDCKPVKQ